MTIPPVPSAIEAVAEVFHYIIQCAQLELCRHTQKHRIFSGQWNILIILQSGMVLLTASIASGSNGNCYYIGNDTEAVLVDAGISCRETERRMASLGLSMQRVKAIFISHEHTDHIKGVALLSSKYQLPVYITPKTFIHSRLLIPPGLRKSFSAYESVKIGQLTITAFPKNHDAADPHSFIVGNEHTTIGIFTDIGSPCEHVVQQFRKCHAAFLETNYDEEMLEKGSYPFHLKQRIAGTSGHLSNKQALELFLQNRAEYLQFLFLSHLSKDNNCPDLVHTIFSSHANNTRISVASRYKAGILYRVNETATVTTRKPIQGMLFSV